MDCENCRHSTVVGLHDTGPRSEVKGWVSKETRFHLEFRFEIMP